MVHQSASSKWVAQEQFECVHRYVPSAGRVGTRHSTRLRPCQNGAVWQQPMLCQASPHRQRSPARSGRRIVLCYPVEPRHVAQIAAAAPQAEVIDAGQERVAEELLDADIFCGHPKVPVPWDDVVRRGRLRWIQSSAAGLDHCLVPSVVDSDIIVTSASGVLANQVADHTMALLAGLLRSLPTYFRAQQKREFIRRPTRDLHGARIGIIGLGRNGRRLAEVLSAFRTTIVATDWFPVNKPPQVAELLPADAVDEILPRIDILILAAPLTERHPQHDRRPATRAAAQGRDRHQRRPRPARRHRRFESPRWNPATSAARASTSPNPSRCRPKAASGISRT